MSHLVLQELAVTDLTPVRQDQFQTKLVVTNVLVALAMFVATELIVVEKDSVLVRDV